MGAKLGKFFGQAGGAGRLGWRASAARKGSHARGTPMRHGGTPPAHHVQGGCWTSAVRRFCVSAVWSFGACALSHFGASISVFRCLRSRFVPLGVSVFVRFAVPVIFDRVVALRRVLLRFGTSAFWRFFVSPLKAVCFWAKFTRMVLGDPWALCAVQGALQK